MNIIRFIPWALATLLWSSTASAQFYQQPQPRPDWENQYWTSQGTYAGDDLTRNHAPNLSYVGPSDGSADGYVYAGDSVGWVPQGQLVPHTDSDGYVYSLQTHSQDRDLHAMRDQYNTESTRLAKDTGAMGQAMALTNNSSLTRQANQSRVAADPIMGTSVNNLQSAGNNGLLAQTFSGCSQQVQADGGTTGGNQTQEKACSYVQLKYTQGFAAHVYRTVTVTFPESFDLLDYPSEAIARSATVHYTGNLQTNFPSTTTSLVEFIAEFYQTQYPGPAPGEFSFQVVTMPTLANNWQYDVAVTRAPPVTPVPANDAGTIMIRLFWRYQGDPVYTFTKPICDKGDCTITGDEFCKAKWTCNSQLPALSTNGYMVPVSAATGQPPLYNLVQALDPNYTTDMQTDLICMDATLNIDCSGIYSGTACDANGCVTIPNTGTLPNDCPQLAADPSCGQMGIECADWGFSNYSQYCYVVVERFYCYVPTTIPDGNVSTQTTCPGNQPCLDGSCTTWSRQHETGYSRAKALGQQVIAQHFLSDWETIDEQTADNNAIPPDPGATPGAAGAAAAMAEYRDMVKAQDRKLRDHPELLEQLKAAAEQKEAQP